MAILNRVNKIYPKCLCYNTAVTAVCHYHDDKTESYICIWAGMTRRIAISQQIRNLTHFQLDNSDSTP
jgi:hypothetical protein